MKSLLFILTAISILFLSCDKKVITPNCCALPIQTVLFEILGTDGKSVIMSMKDSANITLSFSQNGTIKSFHPQITELFAKNDTTASPKYNGLVMADGGQMNRYAISPAAVHKYDVALNNVNIGAIYIDEWGQNNSNTFLFNNLPVLTDTSASHLVNLLQIQ